jgi:hypothetical protein
MISHLLNSLLIGILFADLLERRFPNEVRFILTDITYRAIYFYSKAQIYFTRMHKKINELVESNPTLLKIKLELDAIMKSDKEFIVMNEFIKDGEKLSLEEADACDFALFSWLADDKKCVNKKIIYNINEPMTMVECSDIKFMFIEIQIGENKFKVDLKTDNYNFYLVGNKFTKQFFYYYLKQYIAIDEPINDNAKITLKILDHNVTALEIEFTEKNESIILDKTGYKVINMDY